MYQFYLEKRLWKDLIK